MQYASDSCGIRVEATPGLRGSCPACGSVVTAKCGEIVSWHWAHLAGQDCDTWAEPDTAWHRSWQSLVPPERREVIIGAHRADIVTPDGIVIELQHSHLPGEQIRAREAHYGRMVWIFDATTAYYQNRLAIRQRDGYVTFRWKHPRKSIALCSRPVLLDLGSDLLVIRRIYTKAPCGGWGRIAARADVLRRLGGAP